MRGRGKGQPRKYMAEPPNGRHDMFHKTSAVQNGTVWPMAKPSLRERRAVETRQRIVDVALALFLDQGFDATTIDHISTEANVSPRTFFRYFPTKEALLFHDFELRLAGIRADLEGRPDGETPLDSLTAVLCRMVDGMGTSLEQQALMFRLLEERPSMRSYQRSTVIEHAEQQIICALALRTGRAQTDLVLRATVSLVASCMDVALRSWSEDDISAGFEPHFRATLDACRQALETSGDVKI